MGAISEQTATEQRDTAAAWHMLQAVADATDQLIHADESGAAFAPSPTGGLQRVVSTTEDAWLHWSRALGWSLAAKVPQPARAVLELYLPVCGTPSGSRVTVAHLGQSVDGFIATQSGDSCYVTGRANILHLHRMRALCDAIVVGAETVAADNPQLTVRLTRGPDPTRVILDPNRRLSVEYRVFSDGRAPTLLICDETRAPEHGGMHGQAQLLGIPTRGGRLALDALLDVLHRRGLRRVFIEGGGLTVSAFVQADLVDRLQLTMAPLITGQGRPALRLASGLPLAECLRPAWRVFRMGDDVLFDCDMRSTHVPADTPQLQRLL